jgi:large subunit ribosomal protein L25
MEATLQAVKRGDKGKNEARRHRAAGRLPAVVYGPVAGGAHGQPLAVTVEPKELSRILHTEAGANTLISLRIDGEAETRVLVKDYQLDPITRELLHADFYRVAMDKAITVTVSITLKGEAKGVKVQGGVVDFVTREIELECLPADIPETITVDVTELMMHQGIRVKDLQADGKWTAVSDPETMIVHVVAVKAVEEPAPAAAEAATATPAEPEVIKKGKTEKDEEKEKKS